MIAGKWSGSHYYSYGLGGPEVPSPCEEQGSKRAGVKKVAPDGGMRFLGGCLPFRFFVGEARFFLAKISNRIILGDKKRV